MRSRLGLKTLLCGLSAALALVSVPALAQSDGQNVAPEPEEALDPDEGTPRAAGPDQRTGHWLAYAQLGLLAPFGSVGVNVPAGRVVSAGPSLGAHVGLGLSRVTVLEASGSYAWLPASSGCDSCSGRSFDLGLGFVYHLAQGISFDPWISYGVGYRAVTLEGQARAQTGFFTFADRPFHGLDVARLAVGGDFYPIPSVGVGLFLQVDAGTFFLRPVGSTSDGQPVHLGQTTYGFFQVGVRVALDPLRRSGPAVSAGKTGGTQGL